MSVRIIVDDAATLEAFLAGSDTVRDGLTQIVRDQTDNLLKYIQDEKLSGQVLNIGDSELRDSLQADVSADDSSITGTVSTDVVYAAIQEYGGTITIRKRLSSHVNNHRKTALGGSYTVTIPERSYMRSGLDDLDNDIVDAIDNGLSNILDTI